MTKILSIVLAAFIGVAAVADPPIGAKNHWRNANYFNHYFLYDKPTNTYVETVNCTAAWRFTKVSSDLNNVILYDASRKLSVKLNYDDMFLKYDHETAWKPYQKGTWTKRVRFFHQYNGQWSGTVSRKHGCAWEELLAGNSKPSFYFKAYAEDANSVLLLDTSRNMRVKLNAADMHLQPSGQGNFTFFKGGYWSEY